MALAGLVGIRLYTRDHPLRRRIEDSGSQVRRAAPRLSFEPRALPAGRRRSLP